MIGHSFLLKKHIAINLNNRPSKAIILIVINFFLLISEPNVIVIEQHQQNVSAKLKQHHYNVFFTNLKNEALFNQKRG